jgi:glycosyltransferase involved in cell wall biosynthesis
LLRKSLRRDVYGMSKKIMIITSSEWAGPYIRDNVLGLSKSGFQIVYISLNGPLKFQLVENILVRDISNEFFHDDSFSQRILKVYKAIKSESPNLIQTHFFLAGLIGVLAGKLSRTSVILTRHHIDENYISTKRKLYWIDRLSSVFATHIVVCSQAAKKWMVKVEKCKESKITVINQGFFFPEINSSTFGPVHLKKQLGFLEQSFNLICVSRFTPGKGHELLLDSFEVIAGEIENVKLVFIGHGDPGWLQSIVKQRKLDTSVKVLSERDDIFECILAADVVMHPSLVDSFSQLVVEAQYLGRPIVAFDIAAAREQIIDGETGFIVAPRDYIAMAEKVILLYREKSLCSKMGERAQFHVQRAFPHERMIKETINLFSIIH